MDFNVIIAISGIIIGWLLNELSKYFSVKRENRKIINKQISVLFSSYSSVKLLLKLNERYKKDFELKNVDVKKFNYQTRAYLKVISKLDENLYEICSSLAAFDPFLVTSLMINFQTKVELDVNKIIFDEDVNITIDDLENRIDVLRVYDEVLYDVIARVLKKNRYLSYLRFKASVIRIDRESK